MGTAILVEEWRRGAKPLDFDHSKIRIWTQIHNLPVELRESPIPMELAGFAGKVIKDEMQDKNKLLGRRKFPRFRIELDVEKPILHGLYITDALEEPVWIEFKYERLPNICAKCGRLNHETNQCCFVEGSYDALKFGRSLRAELSQFPELSTKILNQLENSEHLSLNLEAMEKRSRAMEEEKEGELQKRRDVTSTRQEIERVGGVDCGKSKDCDKLAAELSVDKTEHVKVGTKDGNDSSGFEICLVKNADGNCHWASNHSFGLVERDGQNVRKNFKEKFIEKGEKHKKDKRTLGVRAKKPKSKLIKGIHSSITGKELAATLDQFMGAVEVEMVSLDGFEVLAEAVIQPCREQ